MIPQIWNHVRDALVMVGPTGEIVDCNRSFCSLLQCDRAALLGQALVSFLPDSGDRIWDVKELEASPRRAGYKLLRVEQHALPIRVRSEASDLISRLEMPLGGWDVLPMSAWVADASARVCITNAYLCRELIERKGSSQIRWAWEIFADGEKEKLLALNRKAVSALRPVKDELRLAWGGWALVSLVRTSSDSREQRKVDEPLICGTAVDISRQKEMEGYLFASEERFALAVSGSLDGIWDWNVQSSALYCSRRFCQLLGYEPSEFRRVKARLFELIHPKDRRRVLRCLAMHLNHAGAFDVEFRVMHRSGSMRWFRSRGQAIWNNFNGRPSRMAGSLADINENKELRSELQSRVDSIERESLNIDIDPHGHVIHANDRFLSLVEASTNDVIGVPFNDLLVNASEGAEQTWHTNGASGEFAFHGPNGSKVVVRGAISPMLDVDGQVYRAHFFGLDETEKKRAEEALAAETAFRRAVLDSAPLFLVTTDKNGLITMVNHYTRQRIGVTDEEMIGQKTPSFLFDWGANGSQTKFEDLVVGVTAVQSKTAECLFIGKEQERLPVLMSVSAVNDAQQELRGYVIAAQDISEFVRIQQLKTDFVSTVSHELRTPLTSISGALKIVSTVLKSGLPPRAQELIEVAQRNTERLIFLINDLLDMQKIEAGQLGFSMGPFDLLEVVTQAVQAMQTYASEKNIEFRVWAKMSTQKAWGDPERIYQVLVNLLSNAVKFSPSGGQVEVSCHIADGLHSITVSDQGPGIPEQFRARVFDKFSQADSSEAKQKGGTGLGLSIARAIVEKHGGEMSFYCPPEGGTCFTFTCPWAISLGQSAG
jgi:PAS domain S-box-containing protein